MGGLRTPDPVWRFLIAVESARSQMEWWSIGVLVLSALQHSITPSLRVADLPPGSGCLGPEVSPVLPSDSFQTHPRAKVSWTRGVRIRSEERRVGKECRYRRAADD